MSYCRRSSFLLVSRLDFGNNLQVSPFTKLNVPHAAVCVQRGCTSHLLETEVQERNAILPQAALVASTTVCRVQTVGRRLPLPA